MNAAATSAADDGVYGSDSDASSDGFPDYYHPISAVDGDGNEGGDGNISDGDPNPNFHRLPNGWLENGLTPLDLIDGDTEDEEKAEEEEEAAAIESERAIQRAFREDERRRIAPLTAENAVRVREAMRGVSFVGRAPGWASQVPEDQWIDRLRRLRGQSPTAAAIDH